MKFFLALRRPSKLNGPWIFSFLYPRPSSLQGTSFSIILLSDLYRKNIADGGNLFRSLAELRNLSFPSSRLFSVVRILNLKVLPGDSVPFSFFALLLIQMSVDVEERYDLRKVF